MTNNKKLYDNHQAEIKHIIKLYRDVQKYGCIEEFENFVKIYGKNKIIEIVNARGVGYNKIVPKTNGSVLDEISKSIFDKVNGKNYEVKKLYSKYYYTKYKNCGNNELVSENTQILFNCLATSDINIKKTYSIAELNNLIKNKKVVLLDVKERPVNDKNFFSKDLMQVHKQFIATVDNCCLQKNIYPSLKYCDDEQISANLSKYLTNPQFRAEYTKVTKSILKTLLVYELQNQQILISDNLEKTQSKMVKLAVEYKSVAMNLSEKLSLNQKLLDLLLSKKKSQIQDFAL